MKNEQTSNIHPLIQALIDKLSVQHSNVTGYNIVLLHADKGLVAKCSVISDTNILVMLAGQDWTISSKDDIDEVASGINLIVGRQ